MTPLTMLCGCKVELETMRGGVESWTGVIVAMCDEHEKRVNEKTLQSILYGYATMDVTMEEPKTGHDILVSEERWRPSSLESIRKLAETASERMAFDYRDHLLECRFCRAEWNYYEGPQRHKEDCAWFCAREAAKRRGATVR